MRYKTLNTLMIAVPMIALSIPSFGHGYVSTPASRGQLCRQGLNTGCGSVQYEPQSLEAPSGFPQTGPADGKIASAGLASFSPLDEQTSTRWYRHPMQSGQQTFTWTFTANHVSKNWRYYITRSDWNPNLPLSRASFVLTPFCTVSGEMLRPPMTVSHLCQVPSRTGHQIILAVWEVGDTANSFYNVIDVDFKNNSTGTLPDWEIKGQINPSMNLEPRDLVRTRVFDAQGERQDLATTLDIIDSQSGKASTWTFRLAGKINNEQAILKAGQRDNTGQISPVPGINQVYVKPESGIERIEVQIEKATPVIIPELIVAGVQSSYTMVADMLNIPFSVKGTTPLEITATLYDATQHPVSMTSFSGAANVEMAVNLRLSAAKTGNYQLVVVGKDTETSTLLQKTYPILVASSTPSTDYDFVFPANIGLYKAGTKVWQPRNGKIYECKPWPYSGYCKQWSVSATQFEPGFGSAWSNAWMQK